jgi:predicted metal-dependent peptidase
MGYNAVHGGNGAAGLEVRMAYDLESDIYRLLMEEPFFAALSRQLNKQAMPSVPTAGVRVSDEGRFELVYNPEWLGKQIDAHRTGVLKHELYHLIFEHCTSRSPNGKKISKRWNWATDLAINCNLKGELPDGCLMPEKFKYPDFQSSEWYYNKLEEDGKGEDDSKCDGNHGPSSGEGGGSPCDCGNFDDHGGWGEGEVSQEIKDIAKERLREDMRKAAEECAKSSTGWGNVSAETKKQIMRFINGSVNWKAVLRAFVGMAQKASTVNTVKRINKRYPYIHAGKKSMRHANIAISIDQSGSVSDELLSLFYAELDKLANIASFTIVPFDTNVAEDKVYLWKKGEHRPAERVLSGGTDFDAPTEYVNKKRFDGHIVLTDMYAPKPKASQCRRMWMTDEQGAESQYFKTDERVIVIKKLRE